MGRGFILSDTQKMPQDNIKFEDVSRRLEINDDGVATIRRQQEIDNAFWDRLRAIKAVQDDEPIGDFHMVASIPCVLVEKWYSEGFNMFDKNVTIQDVLKRLRNEDADRLITTNRKI